jgi:hypothetical protein
MNARTVIGANRRSTITPGGFTSVRKCSTFYNDARDARRAATAFFEKRGIRCSDGFTLKQKTAITR